jgi:hypothetical protein
MKRPRTELRGKRTGDVRSDLSKAQLEGVGAVAVAYNEAEVLIDILLALLLSLDHKLALALTSRINGIDGKIELVNLAFLSAGATDEAKDLLAETLGGSGFGQLKGYRDAIIHARVLDAPAGIAQASAKRGRSTGRGLY